MNTTFADADDAEDRAREPALQLVGSILDQRYRVDRELGAGGMGVVFKATHVLIDKPVAIKVLRSAHAKQADIAGRFSQEARIASKIKHPNVVEIVDYGTTPMGCPYYVMEYLPGHSLAWEIDNVGRLSPARAIDVALQMTRGLAEAHRHGVVHRDLKPDNVFLIPGGDGRPEQVKILDFGIARIAGRKTRYTAAGSLVGTPEYMSPEQATGREVDHRTDLYAVGTLLFEMLTAKTPFRANAIADVLAKQVYEAPPTLAETEPSLPALVHTERVIRRLLAKSPEERPSSADDLVRLLEQAAAADMGTTRAVSSRDAEAPRPTVMLGSGSVSHEPITAATPASRVGGPRLAAPAAPQGFFAPGGNAPVGQASQPAHGMSPWAPGAAPQVGMATHAVPTGSAAQSEGHVGAAAASVQVASPVPAPSAPNGPPVAAPQGVGPVPPTASPAGLPAAAVGGATAAPQRFDGRREVSRGGPSIAMVLLLGIGAAVFAAFATLGIVGYLQRSSATGASQAEATGPREANPAGDPAATLSADGATPPGAVNTPTGEAVSPGTATAAGPTAPAGPPTGDTESAPTEGGTAGEGQTATTPSNRQTGSQPTGNKSTSKGSSGASKKSSGGAVTPDPPPTPTPEPEPAPKPKPKPVPEPPDPNGKPIVDYGDLKDPFGDP